MKRCGPCWAACHIVSVLNCQQHAWACMNRRPAVADSPCIDTCPHAGSWHPATAETHQEEDSHRLNNAGGKSWSMGRWLSKLNTRNNLYIH
jgi:hypothetical protein